MNQATEPKNQQVRLAIITTHPIQYQVPIWRKLAQTPSMDVRVYFGSDFSVRGYTDAGFGIKVKWDVSLTDGYVHTFLSTDPSIDGVHDFFKLRARGLHSHLSAFKPNCALICAYTPFFVWEALGILRVLRVPVMIRAETTDVAKDRNRVKGWLRSVFLRTFYSQCNSFLAIGQNSRAHYLTLAIPSYRIGWAPYCVDTDLIEKQVQTFVPQRQALRHDLGFTDDCTVLIFAGKLIPHKDPLILVHALKEMTETERQHIGLIVLGDGEQRAEMETTCQRILGERAVFPGFVNQSQLGRYYAAADCLVLPSHSSETWGLVVNEALQFGLPAIVSDRVGCHPDLIIQGKTGYVFPTGNIDALRLCIEDMIGLLFQQRSAISQNCRERAQLYSSAAATGGIIKAVAELCGAADGTQQS